MKYKVKCSCGHRRTLSLYGSDMQRYYEVMTYETRGLCPDCEAKQKQEQITLQEIRMYYREYKENFSDCKYKHGTYDASNKTIIVYVPSE